MVRPQRIDNERGCMRRIRQPAREDVWKQQCLAGCTFCALLVALHVACVCAPLISLTADASAGGGATHATCVMWAPLTCRECAKPLNTLCKRSVLFGAGVVWYWYPIPLLILFRCHLDFPKSTIPVNLEHCNHVPRTGPRHHVLSHDADSTRTGNGVLHSHPALQWPVS
jgi:hypothetical protein